MDLGALRKLRVLVGFRVMVVLLISQINFRRGEGHFVGKTTSVSSFPRWALVPSPTLSLSSFF